MNPYVVEATSETFETEVTNCTMPVLVDFWAPWCQPCKLVQASLETIAEAYEGQAKVVRVNADDCQDLARRYGVRGLPTVLLFNNGRLIKSSLGVRPEQEYRALLETVVQQRWKTAELKATIAQM